MAKITKLLFKWQSVISWLGHLSDLNPTENIWAEIKAKLVGRKIWEH